MINNDKIASHVINFLKIASHYRCKITTFKTHEKPLDGVDYAEIALDAAFPGKNGIKTVNFHMLNDNFENITKAIQNMAKFVKEGV